MQFLMMLLGIAGALLVLLPLSSRLGSVRLIDVRKLDDRFGAREHRYDERGNVK